MPTIALNPFDLAVERLLGKTPVASKLRTKDWAKVPVAIRDRAQLSAAVDSIHTMATIQDNLQAALTLGRDNPEKAFTDRSKFVAQMRQALGAPEGDTGLLTDIASQRRLELIYDFQLTDAYEFGRRKLGLDPDILDAFPAQELIRVEDRAEPRNWRERWVDAGGVTYDGRMVALKTDPIWTAISRFGRPWPPFDFGSGMGLEDVTRDEAIELGVITEDYTPQPAQDLNFNHNLEASAEDLDADTLSWLRDQFGDQLHIADGKLKWREPDSDLVTL